MQRFKMHDVLIKIAGLVLWTILLAAVFAPFV